MLELIFDFTELSLVNEASNEKRNFHLEFSSSEIDSIKEVLDESKIDTSFETNGKFLFQFNFSITRTWRQVQVTTQDSRNGQDVSFTGNHFVHPKIKQFLKAIFSDVEINYVPKDIRNVTALDVDKTLKGSVRSTGNIASAIAQLLIDIKALDDGDFAEWASKNSDSIIDKSKIDVRLKRFTEAFHLMFPNKRFKKIENRNNTKKILFEEYGNEMTLEKLSSGEKQIVFRGSFLLKDKMSTNGSLVLIDEPEISLHPNWQLEIANFYKKLFTDESGNQTSQLIIATHSPFIIHNPNRNNDKVLILKREDTGNIIVETNPEFFDWAPKRAIEQAFNIQAVLEEKPNIFLEGETDEKYFRTAQRIFGLNQDVTFSWVGRLNESGKVEFSGDTALDQTRSFLVANKSFIKSATVLFYDFDAKKTNEDYNKLIIRKMAERDDKAVFKKGVENLLILPEDFDYSIFRSKWTKIDDYGNTKTIESLNKTELCNYICDELSEGEQKVILDFVKREIEKLLTESVFGPE